MDIVNLLVQLVGGVIGGVATGGSIKGQDQGIALNSILGAVGGVGTGHLFNSLGLGNGPLDVLSLMTNFAAGGGGGAALTFVVAAIRVMIAR